MSNINNNIITSFQDLEARIKELELENINLKENQAELNRANQLSLNFFDYFPALVWRSGLDKSFNYFNKTWLNFTGRTFEQEFGNGWVQSVHPDDISNFLQIYENAFDNQQHFEIAYRLKNKFGQFSWIKNTGQPFYNSDNSFLGYIGNCVDITESKHTEQQLLEAKEKVHESEEKFKLLHQNAGIGIGYYNTDGIILSYNQLAAQHMNGNPEDFIGKSIFDLFPKPVADFYFNRIQKSVNSTEPIVYEDFVALPNEQKWFLSTYLKIVNSRNKVLGIQIISQDITNLKNAERELNDNKEFFKAIFEQASAGIGIALPNGKMFNCNQKLAEMLGYTINELINLTVYDITLDEDLDKEKLQVKQIYENKVDTFVLEKRYLHKSGQIVWAYLSSKVVRDQNDQIKYVIGVVTDITERKRVEIELTLAKEKAEENQRQLKYSQQVARIGYYVFSIQSGFWSSSEMLDEIFGIDENYPRNIHGWLQLIHPHFQTEMLNYLTDNILTQHQEFNKSYQIVNIKTNQSCWVHGRGTLAFDESGNLVRMFGTIQDISQSKSFEQTIVKAKEKAEENEKLLRIKNEEYEAINEELRQTNEELFKAKEKAIKSELFYRQTFENSAVGVAHVFANGQFIKMNDSFCKIVGYTKEELLNMNFADITYPDDLEKEAAYIEKIIKNEIDTFSLEKRYIHKTGQLIWISLHSNVVRDKDNQVLFAIASLADITDRINLQNEIILAKQKVEVSQQLFKALIENAPDGVVIIDENGKFTYGSPNAARLFGYSEEELFGHYGYEFTHPDDLPLVLETIQSITNNPKLKPKIKYRFKRKNGEFRWIETTFTNLLSDKAVNGFILNFADVTERKQIYDELLIAKEKAEESDRLKSSFLQNLSHEIRTPLNAICGFAGLITKPDLVTEKRNKFSEIIRDNSEKLTGIITDVIEISQIQSKLVSVKLSEFDIVSFINAITEKFKVRLSEKNLELKLKMNFWESKLNILSDFDKLQSIFKHLIDNAIKFTQQGSIEIGCYLENDCINFSITDTGIGIPAKMQSVIFEPFRQVELGMTRNFGGNGLGLSLVKSYTSLLKGTITLKSEINVGTTFHISIPYITPQHTIKLTPQEPKKLRIHTILIAEDEFANYQYLKELLNETGINILYAANGQEAIEICQRNQNINLILMDIKMPIMDGKTATKVIKTFNPHLPIIAQTAYALEHERAKYEGIFDDYLTKPISEQALKEKLHKFIKQH